MHQKLHAKLVFLTPEPFTKMSDRLETKGRRPSKAPRKSSLSVRDASTTSQLSDHQNAMMDDLDDPLSDSFDPNRLKVAELRSLLLQFDVHVRSSARKQDLINAYIQSIRENANELRAQRNRDLNVRPDGRGIIYLSNGQIQRSPMETEMKEEEETAEVLRESVDRDRGRRSVSFADDSSSETGEDAIVQEPDISADVSSFSMDNPFQSHTPSNKNSTKISGRKSEPAKNVKKQKKSKASSSRHSLSNMQRASLEDEDEADDSISNSPLSPTLRKQRKAQDWVDRGKNLLEKEIGQTSENAVAFSSIITSVALIVFSVWWIWYTRESKNIGFCDSGRSSNIVLDTRRIEHAATIVQQRAQGRNELLLKMQIPQALQPSCTPCPSHGHCNDGKLTECESSDYVLRYPLLSQIPLIGSSLPLSSIAPSCDPDEEKVLLAADLADEIENRLRTWKADVYCNRQRARLGPRDEPDWGQEGIYAIPLSDLYHELKSAAERGQVLRTQGEQFFKQLWDLAMSDLEASNRVQQRSSRLLAVRGPVGVGLSCRVGLAMSTVWLRLRFWLAGTLALVGIVHWLISRLRGTSELQKKAQGLVKVALKKLQVAKQRHIVFINNFNASPSSPGSTDAYLSIAQLRDSLMQHGEKGAIKKNLWSKVTKLVESNANVRTRQAKVQGEWTRVWEWVGPLEGEQYEMVERSPISNASQQPQK
jgi:Man1-Src1p-C-terminal domain